MSDKQPFEFEIWDNETIQAIKATKPIAEEGKFTEDDMEEIDRLLTACLMAVQNEEHRPHPKQIKAQLTGLRNSFGCWLDFVDRGIRQAKIEETEREMFYGAFGMASAFLFDIESRIQPWGTPDPEPQPGDEPKRG